MVISSSFEYDTHRWHSLDYFLFFCPLCEQNNHVNVILVQVQLVQYLLLQKCLLLLLALSCINSAHSLQYTHWNNLVLFGQHFIQIAKRSWFLAFNVPSVPQIYCQFLCDFILDHFTWFWHLDRWHCQVQVWIFHWVNLDFLQVLANFQSLKPWDTGCSCGERWHDSSCFDLHVNPIHWVQLVVDGSKISHRVDKINVAICILVFFKLFGLDFEVMAPSRDDFFVQLVFIFFLHDLLFFLFLSFFLLLFSWFL